MFDFNKLDDYKAAIDDGFTLIYKESEFIDGKRIELLISKSKYSGYVFSRTYMFEEITDISEKDWKTFKKKVVDYFLNEVAE